MPAEIMARPTSRLANRRHSRHGTDHSLPRPAIGLGTFAIAAWRNGMLCSAPGDCNNPCSALPRRRIGIFRSAALWFVVLTERNLPFRRALTCGAGRSGMFRSGGSRLWC
ncbi:hypothetical protein GCM10010167_22010 [Paractinoplanes deccanensis]